MEKDIWITGPVELLNHGIKENQKINKPQSFLSLKKKGFIKYIKILIC